MFKRMVLVVAVVCMGVVWAADDAPAKNVRPEKIEKLRGIVAEQIRLRQEADAQAARNPDAPVRQPEALSLMETVRHVQTAQGTEGERVERELPRELQERVSAMGGGANMFPHIMQKFDFCEYTHERAHAWQQHIAVSPVGDLFAWANERGEIEIYHLETGNKLSTLPPSSGSISWDSTGKFIACCRQHMVEVWDVGAQTLQKTLPVSGVLLDVKWSHGNESLIAVTIREGNLGRVEILDGKSAKLKHVLKNKGNTHTTIAWDATGTYLAYEQPFYKIAVWSTTENKDICIFPSLYGVLRSISFDSSALKVACGYSFFGKDSPTVFIGDIKSGLYTTLPEYGKILSLDWSHKKLRGKKLLVTGDEIGNIKLWDIPEKECLYTLGYALNHMRPGEVTDVCWSPDGTRLLVFVSHDRGCTVSCWNIDKLLDVVLVFRHLNIEEMMVVRDIDEQLGVGRAMATITDAQKIVLNRSDLKRLLMPLVGLENYAGVLRDAEQNPDFVAARKLLHELGSELFARPAQTPSYLQRVWSAFNRWRGVAENVVGNNELSYEAQEKKLAELERKIAKLEEALPVLERGMQIQDEILWDWELHQQFERAIQKAKEEMNRLKQERSALPAFKTIARRTIMPDAL